MLEQLDLRSAIEGVIQGLQYIQYAIFNLYTEYKSSKLLLLLIQEQNALELFHKYHRYIAAVQMTPLSTLFYPSILIHVMRHNHDPQPLLEVSLISHL